jgi:hypothetical protein
MAQKKQTFKNYLLKNFEKAALVGVAAIIVIYLVYALVKPISKDVKDAREAVEKSISEITKKSKETTNIQPVKSEPYIEKMLTPLSKVPSAAAGPAWASYKLPYIMKSWDMIPIRHMRHPACAISKVEDKIRKVSISFTAGAWQADDQAKYEKFEFYRSMDGKNWSKIKEIAAEDNRTDYEIFDNNVAENTEYKYKMTSHAVVLGENSMYKLDTPTLDSAEAGVKTQFTFKITGIIWSSENAFRTNKIVQISVRQLLNEDSWVEWKGYYSVTPVTAGNPLVGKSTGPEIKYNPENPQEREKKCDVVTDKGEKTGAPKANVPVDSLNIGYVLADITGDSPTDLTKEKTITLTLKKPGHEGTVVFTFDKNGRPPK